MKKNMGNTDRVLRIVIAAVVALLYFTNVISGTLAIVLFVLAGIFILTSIVGLCPLYSLFGISSCQVNKHGST
ncbi:MAG: YgaP family membrane protein [Cyclobacteriaceae bacterium]